MRVVLDVCSILLRSSGVKNYIYFWALALKEAAGSNSLSFYPMVRTLGPLNHQQSNQTRFDTSLRIQIMNLMNVRNNPFVNLAFRSADLVHVSQHMRNFPNGPKVTATLFDMSCWTVPETHQPANVRATRQYAESILKRAHGIIAISASARDDAIKILGIPPERLEVIHPGVSPDFFNVDPAIIDAVRARYGLTKPYVLSLGTIEPRKNMDLLLDAYESLPEPVRHEYPLVIAGPEGWCAPSTIARLRSPQSPWRYLGYVPEGDLPGLTAGASVFVFPSLYEGFGLPLAQAMAAGVAGITSNVSSLPEIAGEAALLIDPRSKAELQAALMRLLSSPSERMELGKRARSRAESYSWEIAARKSWTFFERIGQK